MLCLIHGRAPHKSSALTLGLVGLLAWHAGLRRVEASQITWASNALAVNLQSDGAALDGTFVFFLGTFAPGFTPALGNISQWAGQWSTLEATAYNATTRRFAESTDYGVNPAGFSTGTRGYIWGTNGRCGAGEWILLTDPAWTFPAGVSGPGAPALTWSVSQAGEVILGSLGQGGVHLRTAPTGTAAPAALSPDAWRALWFSAAALADPAVSGWEADPDGDGASNLMEYATGTDPGSARGRAWPALTVTNGGDRLEVSLARDCRSRAVWLAQESATLKDWIPAAPDVSLEPTTRTGFRLTLPLSPAKGRFFRFRFALP